MGHPIPKQYLEILGRSVLQWTVDRLLSLTEIKMLVVAVDDSSRFRAAVRSDPRVVAVAGGASRAESVQNALAYIRQAAGNPWVMVHDAARPCVKVSNIRTLIERVMLAGNGGLLALPVTDTVKEVAQLRIERTLARQRLWLAHTPQMFRADELFHAQSEALRAGIEVTDEASAMEWAGYQPQVVADDQANIKITRPDDLALAEWYLDRWGEQQ